MDKNSYMPTVTDIVEAVRVGWVLARDRHRTGYW